MTGEEIGSAVVGRYDRYWTEWGVQAGLHNASGEVSVPYVWLQILGHWALALHEASSLATPPRHIRYCAPPVLRSCALSLWPGRHVSFILAHDINLLPCRPPCSIGRRN